MKSIIYNVTAYEIEDNDDDDQDLFVILGWVIHVILNFTKVIIIMINGDHICRIDGYQIITSKVTEKNLWLQMKNFTLYHVTLHCQVALFCYLCKLLLQSRLAL